MKLQKIIEIVLGDPCAGQRLENLDIEINGACAADLMSDVLTSIRPHALLITGLCNPQVVRTAQMADVSAIVFARGKCPRIETIELAIQENIPLVSSPLGMFEICGLLYQAGMPGMETNLLDQSDE